MHLLINNERYGSYNVATEQFIPFSLRKLAAIELSRQFCYRHEIIDKLKEHVPLTLIRFLTSVWPKYMWRNTYDYHEQELYCEEEIDFDNLSYPSSHSTC